MFQILFKTFKQNFIQFSEQFDFPITRDIEKTLKLCEQYAEQCDDDSGDRGDAIQKNFYDGLQLIIQQLNIFEEAPSKLDEETIRTYESQLCKLLQETEYPETSLNALVFKRMPDPLEIKSVIDGLKLDQPLVIYDSTDLDWPTKAPVTVDRRVKEPVISHDVSWASIFKIFQYHANSFRAYREAIDDWEPLFIFDERYDSQTYSRKTSKRFLRKEQDHWVPYIGERLSDFLEDDFGYWDVPSLFLAYLKSIDICFSDNGLSALKMRIQTFRPQSPERLSLEWLHYYRHMIQKYGNAKQQEQFDESQDIAISALTSKRTNFGNPCYVNFRHKVIPSFVITHCLIPNKKPHFWQRDKKRQLKIVDLMSDASIVQEFSEKRLQRLLENVSSDLFSLNKAKVWMKQIFTEAHFLEEHNQFLNQQLQKNGWLQSNSKKLSKHYQHLALQQTQLQLETLMQAFEIIISRFHRWVDHHDQATFSSIKLGKYETQFQQEAERFQTHLLSHKKRIQRFNRRLPKRLRSHCRIEIAPVILYDDLTSSWDQIHRIISERETAIDTVKEIPYSDISTIDHLSEQKESFLAHLSEGRLLSESELTLLCANSTDSISKLQLERRELHNKIDEQVFRLMTQVVSKNHLLEEDFHYLEQVFHYYQSISHERVLKTFNRRIRLVISEHLQGDTHEVLRRQLSSLTGRFESFKEQARRFREPLDHEKRESQKRVDHYGEEWKTLLQKESDSRVQRVFQEAYSVMLEHRWLRYQSGKKALCELDELRSYMERLDRPDDFEQYREMLELAVWSELENRTAKQALLFFEQTVERGVVSPKTVDRIKTRAWKRVMTPIAQF